MKKIFSFLLIIALLSTLISCKTNSKDIYLFIYDIKDPYIADLGQFILEEARPYFEIELHDAQNSQVIQNERIEEVIALKPKLLIINPVDRLGVLPIIEKAKTKNIPIIFINREPLNRDLNSYDLSYYVGAKAEQSGIFQAEIVSELFGGNPNQLNHYDLNQDGKIQMLIFKGEQGHQDAELRTEFIISELERLGYQLDILATEVSNWNKTIAYQRALSILPLYIDHVEIIISNNDAMAIGIIEAIIELEYYDDIENFIPILGIDGIEPALKWMETGHLYATVINDSKQQAEATIKLARHILKDIPLASLHLEIIDDHYVWVDYKKLTLFEETN